jgi:hypothetical protein
MKGRSELSSSAGRCFGPVSFNAHLRIKRLTRDSDVIPQSRLFLVPTLMNYGGDA